MLAKEKKAAWSKVYNKRRRAWYKSRFICVQCGAADAEPARTLCKECAQKQKRNTEKSDPGRRRDYANTVKRKADRYAAGLCTNCGKRPHRDGFKTCEYCAKKQREWDMNKRVKRRIDKQIEDERRRLNELRRISNTGAANTK